MAIKEHYIGAEEFWELAHLPENADKHLEVIDGVIYEARLAGLEHGKDAGNLFGFIWTHVRQHDLGLVTAAETGFTVHTDADGKDTTLAPDVGFITKARIPAEPIHQYARLAPDLAVEVVSPNDKAEEIHTKVKKYLQYGTRAVWVAYPMTKTVVVHTNAGAKTLNEDETLEGADVLPGFKLAVRDIFSA